VTADDIAQTCRSVRELTKAGERETHEVVLSCMRAAAPIIERLADYEIDPSLTIAAGGGRSFVRGFPANGWIKWM
jgi:hypothetical protein